MTYGPRRKSKNKVKSGKISFHHGDGSGKNGNLKNFDTHLSKFSAALARKKGESGERVDLGVDSGSQKIRSKAEK